MRTLLIDADILAYQKASTFQTDMDFGTFTSTEVDIDAVYRSMDQRIDGWVEELEANAVIICLSDDKANWRKELEPRYKSTRGVKPEGLADAKAYLEDSYKSYRKPRLEADDVMGILATHPKLIKGEKVIVSDDKDMRTVPANIYSPIRHDVGVVSISPLDADRFHMWQTICGDTTDCYPGAPRVGPKSVYAEELISADREDLWDIVLAAYASVGLTEDDAIHQAQQAHILRHTDYDYQRKEPLLWSPLWLNT